MNLGRLRQRIYSPPPLTTRALPQERSQMLKEMGAAFNQPEGRHSRLERADGRTVGDRRADGGRAARRRRHKPAVSRPFRRIEPHGRLW